MFVQQALGLDGPSRDDLDRLLVERQGVRLGRAADPPGPGRRGGGRRRRHAVRQRAVRLQLAGAGVARAVPPFDADARRHQPGRGRRLRAARARRPAALELLGYGEASDAHHMSTPHPEGLGAERALDDALARAGLAADAIDYINLHGTASTKNDEVEGALVARRFPATHACQLDQGLHRPHARRRRHRRSGDQPAGARDRPDARHRQHHHARRRLRPADQARSPRAARCAMR